MKGRTAASTASLKSLSGPGKVLFFFLLVGGVLASGFSYYGPYPGKVTQGLLIPYRDRDPSKGVVVEEQDVQNYSHITVMTHTTAPKDAPATVTIYADSTDGGKHEVARIESGADAWSRADWKNSARHLTVTITTGAGAHLATQVDVLLFLSKE